MKSTHLAHIQVVFLVGSTKSHICFESVELLLLVEDDKLSVAEFAVELVVMSGCGLLFSDDSPGSVLISSGFIIPSKGSCLITTFAVDDDDDEEDDDDDVGGGTGDGCSTFVAEICAAADLIG